MSNEIKEKEEYEKYARDHRKELDAQEVKLGDVVTVLVGHFAGEKGVIVGMIACDKSDYADPYYEIEMECDVPEEFWVRKTLIGQSRVIGGVERRYLKVIGNRAPKKPSMEIKQGDKVRVSKDAPRMYLRGFDHIFTGVESVVSEVEDDNAVIIFNTDHINSQTTIPTKYLVKVDAEAKEAKFKKGDKVIFIPTGKVKVVSRINANSQYAITEPNGQSPLCVRETELAPYIESNAPKFKVGDRVRNVKSDLCGIALSIEHGIVEVGIPYDKEKRYWNTDIVELFEPTEQTEAEKPNHTIKIPVEVDLTDSYWDAYAADLAKELALKVANRYNDPKEAAEYAVNLAKAVVEGLKRKCV